MGTYCSVEDVWEQIEISNEVISDDKVEKKIIEAEKWVNAVQDTTYSTVPDLIKYATASFAASLIMDFLYTEGEPNSSHQSARLKQKAIDYLESYNASVSDPESGLEKINSDFFDTDTG